MYMHNCTISSNNKHLTNIHRQVPYNLQMTLVSTKTRLLQSLGALWNQETDKK